MPLQLLEHLSPHARVVTAVLPFVVALVLRLALGKCRLTAMLITASTVWFAANVLLAPYSTPMQQDLRQIFR